MLILLDTYFGIERHRWAWGIGTAFALSAVLVSLVLIARTYQYSVHARLRWHVLLILAMVPVYAVFAWLGLVRKEQTAYWDLVRECWESVAIWAFYEFLVDYCGGHQHIAVILAKKDPQKRVKPFGFLPRWKMADGGFYRWTSYMVIQYIPIEIAVSVTTFVTSLTGHYDEGHWTVDNAYPWLALVVNCSQIVALYGLLELYECLREELKDTRPLYKFLCIKLVVFFTFWQSVFLSMLVSVDVITPTVSYSTDEEALGIDDFIICIEMLLFAIAHCYAFPYNEFDSQWRPISHSLAVDRGQGAGTGYSADTQDEWVYSVREQQHIKGALQTSSDGANKFTDTTELARMEHGVEMQNGDTGASSAEQPPNEQVDYSYAVSQQPSQPPPVPPRPTQPHESSLHQRTHGHTNGHGIGVADTVVTDLESEPYHAYPVIRAEQAV